MEHDLHQYILPQIYWAPILRLFSLPQHLGPRLQSLSAITVTELLWYCMQAPPENTDEWLSTKCPHLTLSQTQILDSSKLREFADNNLKFDENGRKFSK